MQFEIGQAVAWLWLRGAWLGRLAIAVWLWPLFVVATLQNQAPHATGIRWLLIALDLAACGVVAWVVGSAPLWLSAGMRRQKTAPNSAVPDLVPIAASPETLRLFR